ncbi:hypothetical protein Nepgr_030716 [Nepenthes gracilis]|uniref:AT-hook motif nuclear-localized protein n=1 Tax=Nepenthes gracilis TaxID=150966 RepID=A0AAD3Y4I2_NEPGR|nr:hypothetical protein Nepgr_030716 [Nepenthes gracilis]
MDGREGMAVSGSAPYYLHRGLGGSGGSGPIHTGFTAPSGLRNSSNPNVPVQSMVRGSSPIGSAFNVEGSPANFPQGFNVSIPSGGSFSEPVKKKRGRPRKYGPVGAGSGAAAGARTVSLGLSPMSSRTFITPAEKRQRGRPPGTGRKQLLATVGEWMSSSAGHAFTPHVIYVAPGEDIAAKILLFSQQRPRAICIMSASGGVSTVTLRQPASMGTTVTYEGLFEILCLSGSYLVAETGGSHNRTGGVNVSLSSSDGHVIGGAVGGRLVASRPVQVVVCSFAYDGLKPNSETDADYEEDTKSGVQPTDTLPVNASPSQNFTPIGIWPGSKASDLRSRNTDIDLMRG